MTSPRRRAVCVAALTLGVAVARGGTETVQPAVSQVPGVQEKFVDVGGIRTRYLEGGTGDPMVLVHAGSFGDGVDAARFDRNMRAFARHFHVYALDKLGQGRTANPTADRDYTVDAVAKHAIDFIRAVGLSRIHLVGVARSGPLVLQMTLDHPALVRTLSIGNTSGTPETGDPRRREKLMANAPKEMRGAELFRMKQLSYTTEHITDELIEAEMRLMESPKNREARAKLATLQAQFTESLDRQRTNNLRRIKAGELKSPTLLVQGYNDPSLIIQNAMAMFGLIAETNPKVRMHIINAAGHYVYREAADEFNRVITEFIAANKTS
jgi:2-hydroxy-6-oxonona-2,4-dienedioate hydrolase